MKQIKEWFFLVAMVIMSTMLIVGCLSSCNPQRKIQKAERVLKDADALAKICADEFPIKTEYIKGKDSISFDTLYVVDGSVVGGSGGCGLTVCSGGVEGCCGSGSVLCCCLGCGVCPGEHGPLHRQPQGAEDEREQDGGQDGGAEAPLVLVRRGGWPAHMR